MRTVMRTRTRHLNILLVAVVVLFATAGCGLSSPPARVGELLTKSESVELRDAESVQVEINMAAGELAVSGGATELLEADFTYNVDELEPEVEYSGDTLTVSTPDAGIRIGSLWDLDDYRYEWDMRFNNDVPMEMKVEVAAGTADLQLGSLSLTGLEIGTGASDVKVDLSGSSSLTRLNVETGIGRAAVDLSGNWQHNLDANISSGVGELTLRLPNSVCVRVGVEEGLADVGTQGLTKDGSVYVNASCDAAEVTLRIDISAGLGAVNLEVEQ